MQKMAEEQFDNQEELRLTDLRQKIRKDPHNFIMSWMEKNLLHVGQRVMKLLSLQPCSLILPDIPFNSSNVRASFNILFLAPPSAGKSTCCKKYEQILIGECEATYNPYSIRKVTSAKLSEDLASFNLFTLILEDFSQIGNDYDVVKVIEGAVGDEKNIRKSTMREEINKVTQGVGLMCGTWSDLSRYLEYFKTGLLFRFVLLFLDLTSNQKEEIGRYINSGINNKTDSTDTFLKDRVVREYYEELFKIMGGKHEKIEQIKGYYFSEHIKSEIYNLWLSIVNDLEKDFNGKIEFQFNRELHEAYRFLISSALLNVFNRKIDNGIIHPKEHDLNLAKDIMIENLRNKVAILKSRLFLSRINNLEEFSKVMKSNLSPIVKNVLSNLAISRFK
jgi:hypothetical protein